MDELRSCLDRIADAIGSRRSGGARVRAWSIHGVETRRVVVGTKDRETGGPHAPLALSESLAAHLLLVWDDGRVSSIDVDRSALERDLDGALSRAREAAYEDPDASHVAAPSPLPEVALHDLGVARIAGGETSAIAERLRAVREIVGRAGVRTWSGSFEAAESGARVLTSAGLDASAAGTSAGWHVSFDGELGDGFASRRLEPWGEFSARLDRLAAIVARLRRSAPAFTEGDRAAVLHPHVVESLVLGTLLRNLDGAVVAHGEGHFRREAFGSDLPVLREDIALRIDPLEPWKSGSYRFTREGVPAAPCLLVDRGRLVTPILDLKYARRLARRPTAIPYAYDTVHLEGSGGVPLPGALARAEDGVLVPSVLGVHTQDPTSGDFSLSAPQALVVAGGDLGDRVRVTVSGNVFDSLRSDSLLFVEFPGESAPGLLFRCHVRAA